MRIQYILLILLFVPVVSGYPNEEMPAILQEKYPNVDFNKDIILQNDGNGVYVRYSIYSIPSEVELESGWQRIQQKRLLEAQNQTEKLLSKQDFETKYQNQINNLNIVINNSNYIQTKTNWTNAEVIQQIKIMAWHDETLAKGEIVILKVLRWLQ